MFPLRNVILLVVTYICIGEGRVDIAGGNSAFLALRGCRGLRCRPLATPQDLSEPVGWQYHLWCRILEPGVISSLVKQT